MSRGATVSPERLMTSFDTTTADIESFVALVKQVVT